MSCGVLPPADKQLLHFETWLHRHLASAPAGPATRLLRQYATWQQLPRLRARAAARPLTPAACANAIRQVRAATRFLAWASEHDPGPARLSQAGLDTWHATCSPGDRVTARPFLSWAVKTGYLPRLTLPPVKAPPSGTPITQQRRISLLRRALTDSQAPVRTRAAACLTLLFAQPPGRIVRLTIDDIIRNDDGQILLRLGDPPAPVPEPFAALLLQLADSRQNMNTATNPASRWLFPGRRAGQPLHPDTMATLLGKFGIPARAALTASLRQLVLQAPAPVMPRPSATTTTPPTSTPPKPEDPGPAMPPVTTHSDRQSSPSAGNTRSSNTRSCQLTIPGLSWGFPVFGVVVLATSGSAGWVPRSARRRGAGQRRLGEHGAGARPGPASGRPSRRSDRGASLRGRPHPRFALALNVTYGNSQGSGVFPT